MLALTTLHGNITDSNLKFIGNNEALNIAKLISKKFDIDVLTCKQCSGCITVDENYDINKYDKLLIVNGSLNMYGGKEIETATVIYKLLHNFNGQIYYILTDTSMPFIDYYNFIKSKSWAKKYNEDDFKLKNDIIILSQFNNFDYIKKLHKNINIKDIKYIPFALWKIELLDNIEDDYYTIKDCDLVYGGSFRSGKRSKKMFEYFFNRSSLNVKCFGTLEENQFSKFKYFKSPSFVGKVSVEDVINMNNSGLATIIIGDPEYNNHTVTLRVYESLLSDAIVFIDNDFDPLHKILNDDWLYVYNGRDLENKINQLKNDNSLYNKYRNNQKNILRSILNKNILLNNLYEVLND